MRAIIKDFIRIVTETLPIKEPICEFGSLQVPGQKDFADLRPFFQDKCYIGCDIRKGTGVDLIVDLHNTSLPDESVGTVLVVDTLEHVEFLRKAMAEIYRILKPDGVVVLSSVMNFPIHEYPHDYWRFTPQGFQSLLKIFPSCYVDFAGDENFPHTVVGIGFKGLIASDTEFPLKDSIKRWKKQVSKKYAKIGLCSKIIKYCTPPMICLFFRKLSNRFSHR